ncbi:hypothetical protein [Weissella paramesenteroides]|uniref:hypothetical protein n=1 Tax=Weissella paramesenteroides TaxID=1249 RepID=UPI003F742D1A
MFERKATKRELMQLSLEKSAALDEHNARVHKEFNELKRELTNEIDSRIAELRVANDVLHSELTALKADKRPKNVDNTPEIVAHENYYRMTFRDENGSVKTQVE